MKTRWCAEDSASYSRYESTALLKSFCPPGVLFFRDRLRPMRNILGIHMDTCLQPRIAKSPLLNVQEILLSRKQRAATNAVSSGSPLFASQPRD
jgi:hypothetical protein